MSKQRLFITILTMLIGIALTSCTKAVTFLPENEAALSPTDPPTQTITFTPSPTGPPTQTITSTLSPTATPTPIPVKVEDAIAGGTFSEIDTIGKGEIQLSIFSPDGAWFVAVTVRGIYVFDTKTWNESTFISLEAGERVQSVVFSVDGSLFAAGNAIGNVTFWHTDSWEEFKVITVYDGPVTNLDISPDKLTFVTICDEKKISLWNLTDGSLIKSQVRSKRAGPVDYSVDGSFLMVSEDTESRDLTTWSSTDLQMLDRVRYLGRKAPEHAISPFKDVVASFGFQNLTVYDFDTKTEMKFDDLFGNFDEISNIIFIDESNLVIRGDNNIIYLINLSASSKRQILGSELKQLKSKNPEIGLITEIDKIRELGFEPYEDIRGISFDGNRLILENGVLDLNLKAKVIPATQMEILWPESVVLADGSIALISTGQPDFPKRITQGQLVITLLNPEDLSILSKSKIKYDLKDGIQAAALSPDGKILATGLYNGQMIFWDVGSKQQTSVFQAHSAGSFFGYTSSMGEIVFSNDSSKIATYGSDKTVKVWNVEDTSLLFSARGVQPGFSPDGKSLVYFEYRGPSSCHLFVKSLEDNSSPIEIYTGKEWVTAKVFTPDRNFILSGITPSMILNVWSVMDKEVVAQLPMYTRVNSMVFNPLGTKLYIRSIDGVISVWGNKPN